jgi:putative spermidine/putrescine transport system substrate-binding protein
LQKAFDEAEAAYGLPLQALGKDTVPVVNAEYTTRLEALWEAEIAG